MRGKTLKRTLRIWLVILVILGGLGFVVYEVGDPMIAMAADYRTSRGEIRTVVLKDGTTVYMGATSSISTSFTPEERRVKVLAGEAWFVVKPVGAGLEKRPFVLRSIHGTVTTNGPAEFVVVRYTDAATIFGLRGVVTVSMNHPREGWVPKVDVKAGQLVHFDSGSGLSTIKEVPDIEIATAWQRGRLVLYRLDLSEAIARINRYVHGWVILTNSKLSDMPVTGDFDVKHVDDVIQDIARQTHARIMKPLPFLTVLY
jgi:transmembrane sensor